MKKNKDHRFRGHGPADGRGGKMGVHTHRCNRPRTRAKGQGRRGANGDAREGEEGCAGNGAQDARLLPGYKADDTILTNIEILALPALPKSLVVIGSGRSASSSRPSSRALAPR